MASNARKHTIPAGTDTTVSRATIFETFGNSIRDIVTVASVTERSQVVTALTSAGQGPTTARPLVVFRADAPGLHRIESTINGTVWTPASGVLQFASKSAADSWGSSNGGYLSVNDRAMAGSVELTWTGAQWVGDWRDASLSGSGFVAFGAGVKFKRVGSTVFFNVSATKDSPWTDNWSVAAIPADHRPAYNFSVASVYGDVAKEVTFTSAGSVVISKAGSIGITVAGAYAVA